VNYPLLVVAGLIVAFAIFKMLGARPQMTPAAALDAIKRDGAILIDVREPDEWTGGVAAPAVLLPLSDLRHGRKKWGPFLENHRGQKLLLYCAAGVRSGVATRALRREGFHAINLGGFSAWTHAGLPTRASTTRAA
jgi:rhodanese-related sulfurtransferase